MPRISLFLLVGALALVAAACTGGRSTATAPGPATTTASPGSTATSGATEPTPPARSYAGIDPAPEFPEGLDWLNTDGPLSLAELRGKVVLLDFWTYGCINCIHIIPDLERLESEFDEELVVIGVHSAKFAQEAGTENIRNIVLRYGIEHPVVNDHDFQVWGTWGARAWPTVALVDPAGNVVGAHEGEGVYGVVQPVVRSLVDEFDAKGLLKRGPLDVRLEGEGLPATALSFPGKVHADPAGDRVFVADTNHHRVVAVRLSDAEVLAVYGSGRRGYRDGPAEESELDQPQGMALSPNGAVLYVADVGNHAIRAVDLDTGEVTTVAGTGRKGLYPPAGGIGPQTGLHSPWDVAVTGRTLYVAMAGSHQIWTVDLETLEAVPFAGNALESTKNGPAGEAELAQPSGVAVGADGRLYFADSESSSIRYVDLAAGEVDLLVGADSSLFDFGDEDGVGAAARLQHPLGVSWHDGALYVADTYNSKIKVVDPATREITTLFGGEAGWQDGGDPRFYEPGGLHVVDGVAYVADTNNHVVRTVDLATGKADTLVLRGIENFSMAATEGPAYDLVALPPTTVGAGPGTITLDIVLPPGHKVNEEAPSSITWTLEGGVALAGGTSSDLTGAALPVVLPADFTVGKALLAGDLTLIWCAEDAESLCFIEQLRLEATLEVGDGETSDVTFRHEITLPGV